MQKLEKQGGYSGNTLPTMIPEEPMTKGLATRAHKVYQKQCQKRITQFKLDTVNTKYKPTPTM